MIRQGYITEGSSSNTWIIKGKIIMTRHADNLILSGITRDAIFKCAKNLGYEVVTKNISLQDAQSAHEAFITSATAFITPVVKINTNQIGDGKPGKFVTALRAEYIKQAFDENYQQTEKYINFVQTQKQYDETKAYTDKFFAEHGDWLEERQIKGMIRECHGDLHLNNICQWQGEIQLFDRIEFNESFRFVDVMYDIAFTAMDLTARGREDFANLFVNTYLEQTADWEGLKVLPLYLTRQAYVRAKVNSFLLDGDTFSEKIKANAQDYYQLAWHYTQPQKPRLILMSGFSASGKSTIGKVIAKNLNAIQIRSDAVRKHLAGIDLNQTGSLDIYSLEMSQKTFARLAELARILITLGYPVILDARYDKYAWREPLLTYAQNLQIPFHIVHCHAPIEVLKQRIAARKGDISDATIEVLNAQIEQTEPFHEKEQPYLISLDTTNPDWPEFLESQLGK